MEFVAIDVETANTSRSSICAFGVVEVVNGEVVNSHRWLTKPPREDTYFDPFFTLIHGIRAEDVEDAPPFTASLDRLTAIVGGRPVIGHNAAFDIGAVRDACSAGGLDWPDLTYGCSLVMSRRRLDLVSFALPNVCDHLGIELTDHHNPAADAEAAARIVLALADRAGASTLDGLAAELSVRLGKLNPFDWTGCVGKPLRDLYRSDVPPAANENADPEHPLFGREIVFTGALSTVRREAWAMVAGFGAIPAASVTKRTDYLVIGDGFSGQTPEEFHTGKAAKATQLRAKGVPIEVLTEGDLWTMLADTATHGTREAVNQAANQPVPAPV